MSILSDTSLSNLANQIFLRNFSLTKLLRINLGNALIRRGCYSGGIGSGSLEDCHYLRFDRALQLIKSAYPGGSSRFWHISFTWFNSRLKVICVPDKA